MLKISEMTGKLTDIPAINTNTLTNSFCTKMHAKKHPKNICGVCYSQRMLKRIALIVLSPGKVILIY